MRAFFSTVAVVCTLASLGVSGCRYDPEFKDGQLQCSPNGKCPEGYSCRSASNTCFSTISPVGGVPQVILNRFIGNWTLAPTSSVKTTCDDGFVNTNPLSPVTMPMVMKISPGIPGESDLESDLQCPKVGLRVQNAVAHLFDAAPTCTNSAAAPLQTQTWTATQFDIVIPAANPTTAMHTAAYTRVDTFVNGGVVNCTQMVTAPMTKN
ncbi:MAG: hypothetical protein H7X95_02305 [Deltaproteobacteria bacterium]|nr:hypothetical protein [Deltaproteobacteria bacterium]